MNTQDALYFDLNIGEILEAWGPRHAVRELIANALDEQALTTTKDVSIENIGNAWHIRDYGRGLRYEHLKQNENAEKLTNSSKVIGRFGVGLKDAFATLHRHHIKIEILSAHHDMTIIERPKHGFDEFPTLHAVIKKASDPQREGTEVILRGLSEEEMNAAKNFFLSFSGAEILDRIKYGQIIRRTKARPGLIYINGLLVAEEQNFAFSYNVTSLTSAMIKAMNRERANVGRSAFSERVKDMLLSCTAPAVAELLTHEIAKLETGTASDEVKWLDVAVHACKILNQSNKVVFVRSDELITSSHLADYAKKNGYKIIIIPRYIHDKIFGTKDASGNPLRGLITFAREMSDKFEFNFVNHASLSSSEKTIFSHYTELAEIIGGIPLVVRDVHISEKMKPEINGRNVYGLWETKHNRIIIRRDRLKRLEDFADTFIQCVNQANLSTIGDAFVFESSSDGLLGKISILTIQKEMAKDPNLSLSELLDLSTKAPNEVLENPVLPLLMLEDPNKGSSVQVRALLYVVEPAIQRILRGIALGNLLRIVNDSLERAKNKKIEDRYLDRFAPDKLEKRCEDAFLLRYDLEYLSLLSSGSIPSRDEMNHYSTKGYFSIRVPRPETQEYYAERVWLFERLWYYLGSTEKEESSLGGLETKVPSPTSQPQVIAPLISVVAKSTKPTIKKGATKRPQPKPHKKSSPVDRKKILQKKQRGQTTMTQRKVKKKNS